MPEHVIINGGPGTRWVNDTDRVLFQFIASLTGTCGACLQYHTAIGPWWGIPIHRGCKCRQVPIRPGATAPLAFVDFRQLVDDMSLAGQIAAIGEANYRLLKQGVVNWSDVVTQFSVRPLEEVVAFCRISLETMLRVGIPEDVANQAFEAVHTPEQDLIRARRDELLGRLMDAGVSLEAVVGAITRAKLSQEGLASTAKTQDPIVDVKSQGEGTASETDPSIADPGAV